MALLLKNKQQKKIRIIYDGRGAISDEWNEYNVVQDHRLLKNINSLEENAIINSDYRIAVSESLVSYWNKVFNYKNYNHVVIPCTINNVFEHLDISNSKILKIRNELNFKINDIVFVYSGSLSGWQSFDLLINCVNCFADFM